MNKKTIHCLLIDDDKTDAAFCKEQMDYYWKTLAPNTTLDIREINDPTLAAAEISTRGSEFHFFVIDLYFPDETNPQGIDLIKRVRDTNKYCKILVLTRANATNRKEAETAGADKVLEKSLLRSHKGDRNWLEDTLRELLLDTGYISLTEDLEILIADDNNYALTAAVHEISLDKLGRLLQKLVLGRLSKVTIAFVAPGFSGSGVLHVACKIQTPETGRVAEIDYLLKYSNLPGKLESELQHFKNVEHFFPDQLFLSYLNKEVKSENQWTGLLMKFDSKWFTMKRWLSDKIHNNSNDITNVFTCLFDNDRLGKNYLRNIEVTKEPSIILLSRDISLQRLARIQQSIDELFPIIQNLNFMNLNDKKIITDFIDTKHLLYGRRVNDIIPTGRICYCHGDLHLSNILIKNGAISLIDPARTEMRHWASDHTRLLVSIMIESLNSGPDSYQWSNFQTWLSVAKVVIDEEKTFLTNTTYPELHLVEVLYSIRKNIWCDHELKQSDVLEADFLLCLVFEFLRHQSYPDFPPPKRALALVAACLTLKRIAIKTADQTTPDP